RAQHLEPGDRFHPDVADDDVGRLGLRRGDRLHPADGAPDREPLLREDLRHEVGHARVVVDDEDLDRGVVAHAPSPTGSGAARNTISNTAPPSGWLAAVMQPPCRRMISPLMLSPSPVPRPGIFVVKNGSKMRERCSSAMPRPESLIRM